MAEVYDYVFPAPVEANQRPMGRGRGGYSASATADAQFAQGDLVEIISNFVEKSRRTTAANVGRLAFAASPWDISPLTDARYPDFRADGVPLELMNSEHRVVFTYQDSAADTADHAFVTADLQAVQAQEQRELIYNTSEGVYTIRDGTTQPAVQMIRVIQGVVGDSNVAVLCKILDANRLEST